MPLRSFLRQKLGRRSSGSAESNAPAPKDSTQKTVDPYEHLPEFSYEPFSDPSKELRFVHIQPGNSKDPIVLSVTHAQLSDDGRVPVPQVSKQLLESLVGPAGWSVHQTLEGRTLFCKEGEDGTVTTRWDCPVPGLPLSWLPAERETEIFEPEFEALSYMWGEPGDEENVLIRPRHGGPFPSSRFRVRKNLASALRHLRLLDKPRTMWIDAVCINQNDNDEKTAQVRRMSTIYKCAHRVVIWLGPEDKWSARGIEALNIVGKQVELLAEIELMRSPDLTDECWLDGDAKLPFDTQTFKSIFAVVVRPWWSRLWIVQEVQLANHRAIIQCGHDSITVATFRNGLMCLGLKRATPQFLQDVMSYVLRLLFPATGSSCSTLLGMSYGRKCFDPRDHIYGMLGLFPPKLAELVRPDYTAERSQVYKDFCVAHLSHSLRFELLLWAYQAARTIDGPSWLPDISAGLPVERHLPGQYSMGASRAHYEVDPTGKVLSALGMACDAVSRVSKAFENKGQKSHEGLRDWMPSNAAGMTYPTSEAFLDVFATTLLGNQLLPRLGNDAPTLQDWKRELGDSEIWPEFQKADEGTPQERYSLLRMNTALSICHGRAFFTTQDGYVGLAPPDAKPKDLVCTLLGCSAPIVLRQTQPGSYKVVGPCFVHGLDDGRSILGPLPRPWIVQVSPGLGSRHVYQFHNLETREITQEDPRLGGLENWERIEHTAEADDPEVFDYFRHKESGELMNSDPRLLPEALDKRGVQLTKFALV